MQQYNVGSKVGLPLRGGAGEGPSRLSSRLTHFGGEEKAGVTFVSIYNFTQDSKNLNC
jgi:hypothetical protein